ncbi:MAG: hypothetical protein WD317_01515 [Balneolaceae bacterium]
MKYWQSILLIIGLTGLISCDRTSREYSETDVAVQDADLIEDVITIEEWRVPWDGRPRDPYIAPDETVWFVGQQTHYIGFFNPATAEFGRHDLEDGTGPHTVVVADDGTLWYAGNRARHIGRMHPETGEITKYMIDEEHARDPHTFAIDHEGNIWFTAQGGNGIGKFNTRTGDASVIPVQAERSRPYGIVMDTAGERPWIALFGTNKLATVDPGTMELEEIELPREEARPRRIAVTSDDNVWYCDYAAGQIGRYNPSTGEIDEWAMPEGDDARPYAMTKDHKDRLWVVTTGTSPNRLVGFDPATEEFFASEEIENGGGTVRHMVFHEPDRAIWFGTDTNYLGRATVN